MSRLLFGSLAVWLSLASPLVRAHEPRWPVARGPAEAPLAYQYKAADLAAVPADFLNEAAACYLYSGTAHTLEADGTIVTTTQEVIRLNNRKGIDQLGEFRSITFSPAYETIALHEAKVHKANGKTEAIGPRHVQVRDVNTDHLVYESGKQVVISFPGLEVGDVLEVHWTIRGRHPEFKEHFFPRYTFGNDKFPVARDEWTIRLPKSRELKYAPINCDLKPTTNEEGDRRVFRWTATNCPAPPHGDRKPPADEHQKQVAVTTFPSWDAVHRWEKQLLADRSECPAEAKAVVEIVTRGQNDPTAKAKAIVKWVRSHMRYVSCGETHDYTPHRPAQVIADRCGDCKDCAHLLALMCRATGLKAGCATLGPRGDGQVLEAVPSPWGTHALTVITIDGQDHWIDTTSSQLGWDVLPPDDRDRPCFVTDEAGLRLARTPKLAPSDNRSETHVTLNVAVNGDVRGERVDRYFGVAAWMKREELAHASLAERRQVVAGELQDAFARARLEALKFDGLDDPDKPLTVTVEFTAPEFFSGDGTLEARVGDPTLWTALLGVSANPERIAPLELGEPFESKSRFTVYLPAAFRLEPPAAGHEIAARWGRVRVALKPTPGSPRSVEIDSMATLTETRVARADFDAWHDFQEAAQAICRTPLTLKPTKDPADIPLLEVAITKAPEDGTTAAVLATIYLSQKKIGDAERILKRACEKSPQDRNLWELRTSAAADVNQEVELFREMVQRFPNEPKYALDLGSALIDQGEYADAQKVLDPLAKHKTPEIQAEALISLAHLNVALDEPKKALRHLAAAEKALPDCMTLDTWLLKGQAHEAAGQPRPAIEAYRKAADSDDMPEALDALIRLTIATGARTEALECLRRLVANSAGDPNKLARAAEFSVQLQRYDDALEFALSARTDAKDLDPKAHRPLGLAYFHRREFAKAVEHLGRAEPDAEGFAALAESLIALGRLGEAEAIVPRFATIEQDVESRRVKELVKSLIARRASLRAATPNPDASPRAIRLAVDCFVCAESLHVRGVWPDRVEALLDEALTSEVKLGPAFGLRAVLSAERGRLTKALGDAERAIALSAEHPAGFHARGRARFERGQPGALDDLEKAARLSNRGDARILHDLAAALSQAKRTGDALAVQREAAKLRPDDHEIRGQLRELEGGR